MICPSDSGADPDHFINPTTGQSDAHLPCDNANRGVRAADESYYYGYGYVLDKLDADDGIIPAGTLSFLGEDHGEMSTQMFFASFAIPTAGTVEAADGDIDTTSGTYAGVAGLVGPYCTPTCGNSNSDTIYRLREGIERFLITDINNAAASAVGQSEIPVMWDDLATVPSSYNHVPGGSNVLYLDGHVEFMRYERQGDGPVSGPVAETIGFFVKLSGTS